MKSPHTVYNSAGATIKRGNSHYSVTLCSGGPGDDRAGPGERGGAAYGRRAVATAKGASMRNPRGGKGANAQLRQ